MVPLMAPLLVSWVAAKPGNGRVVVSQTIVVSKAQVTNVSSRVLVGANAGKRQQEAAWPNASVVPSVSGAPNVGLQPTVSDLPNVSGVAIVSVVPIISVGTVSVALHVSIVPNVSVARKVSTVPNASVVPNASAGLNASVVPTVGPTTTNVVFRTHGTLRTAKHTTRTSGTPVNVSRGRLQEFLAVVAGKLKRSTSTRQPAVEMLQEESFEIDHRGWRSLRLPRAVPTDFVEPGDNSTLQGPAMGDRDTQAEMLLFGALLLLGLAALMAYEPTRASQGIKLRPSNSAPMYERLPSFDDSQFADEIVVTPIESARPLSDRIRFIVWTRVLASRLARRIRDRVAREKGHTPRSIAGEVGLKGSAKSRLQPQPSTASLGFESAAESRAEPYTANFMVRDVPAGVRRLLVNVKLRQKSPQGRTHTYQKEMAFDLDTWRLPQ
ncbi:unnamed protein product [Ixodes persulcatus]